MPSRLAVTLCALLPLGLAVTGNAQDVLKPGTRTMVDAHNCYPYNGKWADRIDRALATGMPIGIEQDVFWYRDPATGAGHSVLSHDAHPTGDEPTLESYFFTRVKPFVEEELKHPHPENWPIISLNLDLKTSELEHARALYAILQKHKEWLTTAERTADQHTIQPLHKAPILVFVGGTRAEEQAFYDDIPVGQPLLAFGAVHVLATDSATPAEKVVTQPADNFHRWWNNGWGVVETGGASKAGPWSPAAEERLRSLIQHAHKLRLWIRFYTIDGESKEEEKENGWFNIYNFGTPEEAAKRISALAHYHADWIATDQYESAKAVIRTIGKTN